VKESSSENIGQADQSSVSTK